MFGLNNGRGSKPAKKATVLRFLRGRVFREEREGGDVSRLRDSIHEKRAPTSRLRQGLEGAKFAPGFVWCEITQRGAQVMRHITQNEPQRVAMLMGLEARKKGNCVAFLARPGFSSEAECERTSEHSCRSAKIEPQHPVCGRGSKVRNSPRDFRQRPNANGRVSIRTDLRKSSPNIPFEAGARSP